VLVLGRTGLQQLGREIVRLCQQEHAYLGHVRASGDVDQVLFLLRIPIVRASKIMKLAVDLLEVPGIIELHQVVPHRGLRRDVPHVLVH